MPAPSPGFWTSVFDWVPITQNLIANLIWLLTLPASYYYGKLRASRAVSIHVDRVEGAQRARTKPRVMIAGFSGYHKVAVPQLSDAEFREALSGADITRLPLDESTRSIGPIVRILRTYESLEDLYLVTTESKSGISSRDSVPLLRRYIDERLGGRVKVHADDSTCVRLDQDENVTRQSYSIANGILRSLGRRKKGEVLVDLTGGPKSMTIGLLLACVDPDQDAHLVGSPYLASGDADYAHSFPLLVQFDAHVESR